jgi:hypothetical protein
MPDSDEGTPAAREPATVRECSVLPLRGRDVDRA